MIKKIDSVTTSGFTPEQRKQKSQESLYIRSKINEAHPCGTFQKMLREEMENENKTKRDKNKN